MSTQVEARVDVGTSDMGNVFIFHFVQSDGETWQVRAGNHTVATVDSAERANAIAVALCGQERLNNAFVADVAPAPAPEADTYAAAVWKKVSGK